MKAIASTDFEEARQQLCAAAVRKSTLFEFLSELGLADYIDTVGELGIDRVQDLEDVEKGDVDDMKFSNSYDRKRFHLGVEIVQKRKQ